jgi:hypothetical protein
MICVMLCFCYYALKGGSVDRLSCREGFLYVLQCRQDILFQAEAEGTEDARGASKDAEVT